MVWTVGNNAFEEPTSRSASRNSSQVTVPLQKVCVCAHNPIPQSLEMRRTTKQEKCRKLQPVISAVGTEKCGESPRITLHHLSTSFESCPPRHPSSWSVLQSFAWRVQEPRNNIHQLSPTCSGAGSVLHFGYLQDTAQHYFELVVAQPSAGGPTTCPTTFSWNHWNLRMAGAYQEAHLWRRFAAEPVVDDPGFCLCITAK